MLGPGVAKIKWTRLKKYAENGTRLGLLCGSQNSVPEPATIDIVGAPAGDYRGSLISSACVTGPHLTVARLGDFLDSTGPGWPWLTLFKGNCSPPQHVNLSERAVL